MRKNYTRRDIKEYNWFRKAFQKLWCGYLYGMYFNIMFRLKIEGRQNLKKIKGQKFILAGNHLSAIDPFLITYAFKKPVAFMAKQELFEKFFSRLLMDFNGAFAVNRGKTDISTIKTAISIKNTDWTLALFPQGKRDVSGKIQNIQKGFAAIAKTMKAGIVPVAITGIDKRKWWPWSTKVTVKFGELIPYSDNVDGLVDKWSKEIAKLTGFEYNPI